MFERNHKPSWTSEELEIVYKNYDRLNMYEIAKLIPTRSLSAVKNKIKRIKYGHYHKRKIAE